MFTRTFEKVAGFAGFFSKPKTKALVVRSGVSKLSKLPDAEHLAASVHRELNVKPIHDGLVGAAVGGVGGALLPVKAPATLTKEQEQKRRETLDWWHSLSFEEKQIPRNIKKFHDNYQTTASEERLQRASAGMIGLGIGAGLLGKYLRGRRINRISDTLNSALPHIMVEAAPGAFGFGPAAKRNMFERGKGIILKETSPVFVEGDGLAGTFFPRDPSLIPRERAYKDLMKRLHEEGDTTSILPRTSFERFESPDRVAGRKLEQEFLGRANQAIKQLGSEEVSSIITRLKGEGITDVKKFVRAYHPDRNKNVPREIISNFGEIVSRLRGDDELGDLVRRSVSESNSRIDPVNSMLTPILIKNWSPK